MRKALLLTAVFTMAVSMTACSKSQESAPTTEAETQATETEAETEEEIEEDYASGVLSAIEGNILTVTLDEDESEKTYDISNAELINEFPLSEGDWLEITFPAESEESPIPALVVEVYESVIGKNTDPTAEGMITDVNEETLTLEVDGESYLIHIGNAYVVGEPAADTQAKVTYIGDLDDEPMAVKVVTEDSYDAPEAEINAVIGTISQIGEDGSSLILESTFGDFYTFVSDEIDFSDYAEGQKVQISYTGTITAKEVPATEIVEK